jgi:hypothetical protein
MIYVDIQPRGLILPTIESENFLYGFSDSRRREALTAGF